MEHITNYIFEQVEAKQLSPEAAKLFLKELQGAKEDDVAIIGMSCRFPNTKSVVEYWENLSNSVNCFMKFPKDRIKYLDTLRNVPHYSEFLTGAADIAEALSGVDDVKAGYLEDVDKFDAAFFNIPPREAKYIDSLQRVFLQTAWSAIEDAGYGGKKIVSTNTGVYVGRDNTGSTFYRWLVEGDPLLFTGTWEGILASRISYIFNLRGPAMVVDTACSSGLVAIHNACQAIKNKECDMALAGGVALGAIPQKSAHKTNDNVLSSVQSDDNILRTFDKKSTGTIFGEGVGAILLKPLRKALEDRDNIYAVIKGSAANNDGASNGITAPNPVAQEELLVKAWESAKISPETIGYIEAHGTGTLLGDPIEVKGLTGAFRRYTDKKQFCGIGSVKTNMGHLVGASGLAGLIKVVLSLKHKKLLPTMHFEEPNTHINFQESPLYVSDRLKDWVAGDFPRRGGVSAFGFSGTNCHVVLEEAPVMKSNGPTEETGPQLFALSAKSVAALTALVEGYCTYLSTEKSLLLQDVCYTASTGRGHYEHRLIMTVSSMDELKRKMTSISRSGLEHMEQGGIWYGVHRIVSDKKKLREPDEVTESEKRQFDKEAQIQIKQLLEGNVAGKAQEFKNICRLYIRGSDFDWDALYKGQQRCKVSLPVYPYEKTSYWADSRISKINTMQDVKTIAHPLLDRLSISTMTQDIYTVKLNVDTHWVLKDHRILGNYVLPGTAYIDLFRVIGERYFTDTKLELKDLMFYKPLAVGEDQTKEAQILVTHHGDYLTVAVNSQDNADSHAVDGVWVKHVEGKVYALSKSAPVKAFDVKELYNREGMRELGYDFTTFNEVTKQFASFGPRWFNVNQAMIGSQEMFIDLELPEAFAQDLSDYMYHPALLDAALNIGINEFGDGMYLPLSFGSFKCYDRMPGKLFSYIKKRESSGKNLETMKFDVYLMDADGRVFVEIEDYTIKKISRFEEMSGRMNTYFQVNWTESAPIEGRGEFPPGNLLVFRDSLGWADRITQRYRNAGHEVVEVELGNRFLKRNENFYVIDGSEENYHQLMEEVRDRNIRQFVHLFTLTGEEDIIDFDQLKEQKCRGVDSLFYLTKALVESKSRSQKYLTFISDYVSEVTGDEERIHPHHAAFFGLGKVVPYENLNFVCKTIDIDNTMSLDLLLEEMKFSEPLSRVAYREGRRYVEQLSKVNMSHIQQEVTEIREGGVYVITGGSGGIGLEVAQYLASRSRVKLCLINRSRLQARSEWGALIEGEQDAKLAYRLKALMAIEEGGSQVSCFSADISDPVQMQQVIAAIRAEFGAINGIVHAAGLPGDGFIIRKDKRVFDEVLAPKIEGTWVLDQLTRDQNIDFMILFSSMVSVFSAPGQGDYTAANAYLNAYSEYRNKLGLKTIAINWTAWTETGMAVDYGVGDNSALFRSLSTREGLSRFEEILNTNLSGVVTGDLNYKVAAFMEIESVMRLSKEVKASLNKATRNSRTAGEPKAKKAVTEVVLTGKSADEFTETERALAQIYASVLEIAEIDTFDTFNEMGGDSIMATELLRAIETIYPNMLDISDVFSQPSISEMAEYIDSKRDLEKPYEKPVVSTT